MRLKDHYRTLSVTSAASAEDIRKAFRRLALKYHPDRNQESPFAEGHFRELKEAYNVLGDEVKRRQYDEERWLLGMAAHKPGAGRLTPEWIVGEGRKLRSHLEKIDTYRMNHKALQAYVLLLLSDEHLAVVKEHEEAVTDLVKDILIAITRLQKSLLPPVIERLRLLAARKEIDILINNALETRKRKEKEEQRFPWIIVLVILTIVVISLITLSKRH